MLGAVLAIRYSRMTVSREPQTVTLFLCQKIYNGKFLTDSEVSIYHTEFTCLYLHFAKPTVDYNLTVLCQLAAHCFSDH